MGRGLLVVLHLKTKLDQSQFANLRIDCTKLV